MLILRLHWADPLEAQQRPNMEDYTHPTAQPTLSDINPATTDFAIHLATLVVCTKAQNCRNCENRAISRFITPSWNQGFLGTVANLCSRTFWGVREPQKDLLEPQCPRASPRTYLRVPADFFRQNWEEFLVFSLFWVKWSVDVQV